MLVGSEEVNTLRGVSEDAKVQRKDGGSATEAAVSLRNGGKDTMEAVEETTVSNTLVLWWG